MYIKRTHAFIRKMDRNKFTTLINWLCHKLFTQVILMKKLIIPFIALLIGAEHSVYASTLIDTFNDTTMQIAVDGSPSTVATSNAIGGYRKIEISKTGPLSASAIVTSGFFAHNTAALTSAQSKITWDANNAGLGLNLLTPNDTLDFTGSSCFECFVIDVISIDQGNVDLTFELSDGNNLSSWTATNVSTGINEFSFGLFSGIDLTDIFSIALIVDGDVASDLALNFQGFTGSAPVGTSPAPAPAALWLMITGMLLLRRTRKTQ
jgi:hypothetical protein